MRSKSFLNLGVQVREGMVCTLAFGGGKLLGPLAGAQAQVSEAGSVKAGAAIAHSLLAGPAGLYMGRRSSYVFITFSDGTFHKKEIRGKSAWRSAQQEALEFNVMSGQQR